MRLFVKHYFDDRMCECPGEKGRKREGARRPAGVSSRVSHVDDGGAGGRTRTEPITIQFPSEKSWIRPRPLRVRWINESQLSDDKCNISCQQTSSKEWNIFWALAWPGRSWSFVSEVSYIR